MSGASRVTGDRRTGERRARGVRGGGGDGTSLGGRAKQKYEPGRGFNHGGHGGHGEEKEGGGAPGGMDGVGGSGETEVEPPVWVQPRRTRRSRRGKSGRNGRRWGVGRNGCVRTNTGFNHGGHGEEKAGGGGCGRNGRRWGIGRNGLVRTNPGGSTTEDTEGTERNGRESAPAIAHFCVFRPYSSIKLIGASVSTSYLNSPPVSFWSRIFTNIVSFHSWGVRGAPFESVSWTWRL